MGKWTTAFSMAWGNFTVLPCPYKRWDSNLNNRMLMMLPIVGLVLGGLWALVIYGIWYVGIPKEVSAFVAALYLYGCCGFMHLDGFMDCNDAILSRRPLEERQRILKDSTVGAFAVVTLCFLLLGMYACLSITVAHRNFALFVAIPVVSRLIAGEEVLLRKPIGHSQYKKSFENKDKIACALAMVVMGLVILAADYLWMPNIQLLIVVAGEGLIAWIASRYAQHQLGGMSGDIAGYTICMSELGGMLIAAVL